MDTKVKTIEALLAKAESTTPEEAEALMAKAEALMIKYNIEQVTIEAARKGKGGKPEEIVKRRMDFSGRYRDTLVTGGWYIAKAMSGETVQGYRSQSYRYNDNGNTEKVSTLVLVGFESDVQQAERLIESLVLQSVVARDTWWKTYDDKAWQTEWQKFVERRSFVTGFFSGAADRLRQEREVAERDAREATPGTEVALRDRKAAVDDYMSGLGLRGRRGNSASGRNGDRAGRAAGRSANVGTTSMGGQRRALA